MNLHNHKFVIDKMETSMATHKKLNSYLLLYNFGLSKGQPRLYYAWSVAKVL